MKVLNSFSNAAAGTSRFLGFLAKISIFNQTFEGFKFCKRWHNILLTKITYFTKKNSDLKKV